MKKTFTYLLGGVLCALFLIPSSAEAQTTLASWTFETEYDKSGTSGAVTYTPNETATSPSGYTPEVYTFGESYSTIQPTFSPNVGSGTLKAVTGNQWSIGIGNNNQCLRLKPSSESTITDFTDAAQHDEYYEAAFSATGYSNITLNMAICYTANDADLLNSSKKATMHVVYSVDGGTTWTDAYTYIDGGTWYTYTSRSTAIPVANQSSVIVRIVRGDGWRDASKTWNLDFLTVTGEAIDPAKAAISFSKPSDVEGIVPTSQIIDINSSFKIPSNFALYKEGYTLTGWTDGENTFSCGTSYTMSKTVYELSPVFTPNAITLEDRAAATVIMWDFRRDNGAPTIDWSDGAHIWVAQATIAGKTIDVKMDVNATYPAVLRNTSNTDCAQTNSGTTFTIPSLKDAVIELESHPSFTISTTTIDGSTSYTGTGTSHVSYTVTGTSGSSTIVIGDGSYYKYVKITLPAQPTRTVTITSAKYATYYSNIAYTLPENLQAATVDENSGGTLTLNYRYKKDDVVPAGTGVLLKAAAAGDYTLTMQPADATATPGSNLLHGSDVETTTTGGDKYYALMYGKGEKSSVLGFYWVNESGAAFTSPAHKAWLALSDGGANFFSLEDDVTGINMVKGSELKVNGEYYNLAGQRVMNPTKGLYIVNGKKVIIK